MNSSQLLDHFDRISDAPDAIPRLRRFILDLALRGKLVEKDLNDEPASTLLRDRELVPNPDDEPWSLPPGWAWSFYELIGETIGGGTPSKGNSDFWSGSIPWVSPKDMKVDFIRDAQDHISQLALENSAARLIPAGSLLMVVRGMILAHSFPIAISIVPVTINQDMKAIVPFRPDIIAALLLISKGMKPGVMRLVSHSTHGTCKLLTGDLFSLPLPIPPLAEQHRIVAKVDELMALCDRLEAAQAERERRRDRLTAASLQRLNAPAVAPAFREHADFHLQHLARMTTRPDQIPPLREAILNLAVRGRLIPQEPNDEPASELLKRIQAAKAGLVNQGQVKKPEAFEPVRADEIPFAIPNGWEVVRMGWLARKLGAGSTPLGGKSVYQSEGVPFLRSQNVHDDGLRLCGVAFISRVIHDRMAGTHVRQQDILLNITGASIGRCAVVPSTFVEGNVSQHVAIIRLFLADIREFIHLSLISPFFQKVIDDVQVGVSREGLSMQRLRLFPMLLPPLAEQRRIVVKVEELMAVCDRLEAQLTTAQTESRRLLEAVLQAALAPAM